MTQASQQTLVSIVTPTFGRAPWLPLAYANLTRQTYLNWEWLVFDDSPSPSSFMKILNDAHPIRYFYAANRLTIGEKRNYLIEQAKGTVIAQFDDDDYYGPTFLETMLAKIEDNCDLIKLSSWYLYSTLHQFFAYWELKRIHGWHYIVDKGPLRSVYFENSMKDAFKNNYLGYGGNYVFKKIVWEKVRFPSVNWHEDGTFILEAIKYFHIRDFPDEKGIFLHLLHNGNISRCFPQYGLPASLIEKTFGSDVLPYLKGDFL